MNNLCDDCNITSDNFNNSSVTSTTLIHRLQTWILSQNTPNLTVAGKVLLLNKDCPTSINSATRAACLNVIRELDSHVTTPTTVTTTTKRITTTDEENTVAVDDSIDFISPTTGVVFVLGLLIGTLASTAMAITIALW